MVLGPRFVLVDDSSHSYIDLKLGFLALAKVFRRLFMWAGNQGRKQVKTVYDLFESMATHVYTKVETHLTEYFRTVHFIVCKIIFKNYF